MQVSATKEEIKQSAELVEMYENWSSLSRVNQQHVYCNVLLSVSDGKFKVKTTTLGGRNCLDANNAAENATFEIEQMLTERISQMAKEACEIIRKHMPIPLAK